MSPHRRRCLIHAILEVYGVVADVSLEKLDKMSDRELQKRFSDIEKSIDGAHQTEPVPPPRED